MHKYLFVLLILLNCFGCKTIEFVEGGSSLKIFLKDVDGRSIKDAEVVLEGNGVSILKANYQAKGDFYYFNQVSKIYHTILVTHPSYNPKGYQNNKGLPKEIDLTLFNPYRVQLPGDEDQFYMEDPYKVVVSPDYNFLLSKEFSGQSTEEIMNVMINSINDLASELGLEKLETIIEHCEPLEFFPSVYPMIYIKKNQSVFKRFNSSIIKSLRANPYVLQVGQLHYLTKDLKQNIEYLDTKGEMVFTIPNYKIDKVEYIEGVLVKSVSKLSKTEQQTFIDQLRYRDRQNREDRIHTIVNLVTNTKDTLAYKSDRSIPMPKLKVANHQIVFATNWLNEFVDQRNNPYTVTTFGNFSSSTISKTAYQTLFKNERFDTFDYPFSVSDLFTCFKAKDTSIGLGINDVLLFQNRNNKSTNRELGVLHFPIFCKE